MYGDTHTFMTPTIVIIFTNYDNFFGIVLQLLPAGKTLTPKSDGHLCEGEDSTFFLHIPPNPGWCWELGEVSRPASSVTPGDLINPST